MLMGFFLFVFFVVSSVKEVWRECKFVSSLQTSLQEQQLREATLCCAVPKHFRPLSYIDMWDLDGSSDTIDVSILLFEVTVFHTQVRHNCIL